MNEQDKGGETAESIQRIANGGNDEEESSQEGVRADQE